MIGEKYKELLTKSSDEKLREIVNLNSTRIKENSQFIQTANWRTPGMLSKIQAAEYRIKNSTDLIVFCNEILNKRKEDAKTKNNKFVLIMLGKSGISDSGFCAFHIGTYDSKAVADKSKKEFVKQKLDFVNEISNHFFANGDSIFDKQTEECVCTLKVLDINKLLSKNGNITEENNKI